MKAIMISIKPEWVAKILTGEKTIEIRKTMPKCDLPIDVYIYCTKDKKEHLIMDIDNRVGINPVPYCYGDEELNGKVVAKFTLNKIEHFEREYMSRYIDDYYYDSGKQLNKKFYKNTCLTEKELFDYIGSGDGYAWHISNLKIFDKPKELNGFITSRKLICHETGCDFYSVKPLTKAPQNYCYIETEN